MCRRHHRPVEHAARDDLRERVALDVFHHDVVPGVGHPDLEDRDDVRVMDQRREPRLVEEHLDELLLIREMRVEPLDGDEPLEPADTPPSRARKTRCAMPPCRDLADELVAIELPSGIGGIEQLDLRHGSRVPYSAGSAKAPLPAV